MEAGAITASFELDISDFRRNIGIVKSETQQSTKKISSFIGPAVKSFAALGSALGVSKIVSSSRSAYKDYRKELNNVATVSNLTGKQLEKFGKQFLKLGGSMGKTSDLVSGAYQAFSAGAKDSAQAFDITTKAAKFARGQVTSVSASVDILTTAMNAYGQETIDAGRASDVFATIIRQGKINGDQLSSSIGNSISVYAAAGVAIEELGAGIATMTSKGVSSAETMTKMNAIIRELQKPTDNMAKLMKKLGYESGQVALEQVGLTGVIKLLNSATGGSSAKLYELFSSTEAVSGATALMADNAQMLTDKLDAMNNSAGASDEAFKKQLSGTEFMRDNWDKLLVVLGEKTEPIYTKVGRILESFTSSVTSGDWTQLKKTIKETIPYISAFAGAFAAVGVAIGAIKFGDLINRTIKALRFFSTFGGKVALVVGGITLTAVAIKKAIDVFNQAGLANKKYTETELAQAKASEETATVMYTKTLRLKSMLEEARKIADQEVKSSKSTLKVTGEKTKEYILQNKALNEFLIASGLNIKQMKDGAAAMSENSIVQNALSEAYNVQNNNLGALNRTLGIEIKLNEEHTKGQGKKLEVTEAFSKKLGRFNFEGKKSGNVFKEVTGNAKKFAKTLTQDLLNAAGVAGEGIGETGEKTDELSKSQKNAQENAIRLTRALEIQKTGASELEIKYIDAVALLKKMSDEYEQTGSVAGASAEDSIKAIEEQKKAVEAAEGAIKKMRDEASKSPSNPWKRWWQEVEDAGTRAMEAGAGKAEVFFEKFTVGLKKIKGVASVVFGSISSGISAFTKLGEVEAQNRINALDAEKDEEIQIINEKYSEKIAGIENQNFEEQALEEYKKEEEQNLNIQQDEALFTAKQEHEQKILEFNNNKDAAAIAKENARWAKQRADIIADYNFKKEDMKKRDMDAALRQKIKDKEKQIRDKKIKEAEDQKAKEIKEREEKAKNDKNEIMRQQFESSKAFQIAETVMRGASAAMAAYLGAVAALPFPAGPIVGGIAAAAAGVFAAVQIAAISQQQFVPTAATGGEVIRPGLVQVNEEGGEIRKLSNQELIIPAQLSQEIIAGAIERQAPQGEIVFNNEFVINNADEDIETRIIEVMQEQISYATV